MKTIDYTVIPEHCRGGMARYIEKGIIPGDFLQAVISNKLVESYEKADNTNTFRMRDYADFLHNSAPPECWGSVHIMDRWHLSGGLNGKSKLEDTHG